MVKKKPAEKPRPKDGEVKFMCAICHVKKYAPKDSPPYCSVCDNKMYPSEK